MIKSVEIRNFQSHKNTNLEFSEGVNVIVGQSDSGKTAIIRALKWVTQNRPGGDAFRSNWGGETYVLLKIDENEISRLKSNRENSYQLNDLEFKAFGQGVPAEIEEALNIDEINLQQQMDSPFLLSDTSGNVAAHFNKVAKLDKIDKGLQNIQREINSITSELRTQQTIIESKTEQLEEFVDIDSFEKELEFIEKLNSAYESIIDDSTVLSNLLIQTAKIQIEVESKSGILEQEKGVNEILVLIENKKETEKKYRNLKKLSINIFNTQTNIEISKHKVKAEVRVSELIKLHEKQRQTTLTLTKIVKEYKYIVVTQNVIKTRETQLIKLETEFKKEMPDICPLCETKLK